MQINSASAIAASTTQAQNTADLLAQSTIYSANVAGKTYTADLSLSNGQYVATIPDLPSISASGQSLVLAENNLDARISLIV
jgi:hypothetical protein